MFVIFTSVVCPLLIVQFQSVGFDPKMLGKLSFRIDELQLALPENILLEWVKLSTSSLDCAHPGLLDLQSRRTNFQLL